MTIDVERVRRALRDRQHRAAHLNGDEKFAAVATVLRDNGGTAEVLLIRRALHEHDPWSGHMALPGGRRDPKDSSLLDTAIREAEEEVGIQLGPKHFLGRLDDLPVIGRGRPVGIVVAPFVFAVEGDPPLSLCSDEVAESLWTPLSPLASGARDAIYEYQFEGRTMPLPAFDVDGRVVWGLTYRMLQTLFEIVDPEAAARLGMTP